MNTPRNLRVAGFLAVRSLARGNAGVTLMTVLMLAVVFISVVFLPSLINGAVVNIRTQVTETTTSDLVVTPAGRSTIAHADRLLGQIRETDGVAAATGVRRIGSQVAFEGDSNAWGVDAIDPESYADVFTTPSHLVEGEWLQPEDTRGIVLGIDVAGADLRDRRGYVGSLQHVHAGDRVAITLIGGATRRFVVRGIFDNHFVLSDQGAFVTTAASADLEPTADYAALVEDTFAAMDRLSAAVGDSADAADRLAEGQSELTSAAYHLADGAEALAAQTRTVDRGADDVASSARRVATASDRVQRGAGSLRDGLQRLADQFHDQILPTANKAAQQSAAAAQTATTLAAQCPATTTDPDHCAAEAALAQDLAAAARTAGTSAAQLQAVESALGDLTDAAADLAGASDTLRSAASAVADGAEKVAGGTGSTVDAARSLHLATSAVASNSDRLAGSTRQLARSMAEASAAQRASPREQDSLTRALESPGKVPEENTVTRIFVKAEPGVSPSQLQVAVAPIRSDVELRSSEELTASIQDQIDTFSLINNIMRVISLIVAAITVFILTYVELTNRRRQIGIERAIGIRGTAIVLSYILKSAISALIGITLGIAAYRLAILPFVERHPFQFPNGSVVLVAESATTRQNVVMLVVVAVIAALVPTLNAVRMKILDAIWGR